MAWNPRRGVELRGAVPADAADLARLLGQLGYPTSPQEATERLATLLRDSQGSLLVATDYGPVVGFIALHWTPMPQERHPVARITALVVDEQERGRGIGRMLLKAGAQAARQAGCDVLELTAGTQRQEAHGFYRAQGFSDTATRFVRNLRRNRPTETPRDPDEE
ncbi:GNAT family N-acetyltransferase [Roseomonas marmotae]|uniref:GNAT family N-acetyltransferase n=1 Tax=Roseomonas marmotae TaxID=2768161 RepID=A0ABS3KBF1_9PROT|nr:GNAT family N-acetyltransferase [Roseomonas marmotae]MBO1074779.1 GNAT family N-acetyltransferase [Roseomonas marmotae]QTI80711.1 GNAT family N-acetyltransferase [Roseomonas marmotae]